MKIVRFYYKYYLSLSNVLIMFFILIFLSISYILSIINTNDSLAYNELILFYFENSLYFTKIIMILFSSIMFIKLKSEKIEYVLNIVLSAGYNKKQNYFAMIMSNLIIIVFFVIISFILFLIIGFLSNRYFIINVDYILSFINIILICIYYGLFNYMVILLFNNQFLFIMIILLFLISDLMMNNDGIFSKTYLFFFPNINSSGNLSMNIFYIIFLCFMLFFINYKIYLNKDLIN